MYLFKAHRSSDATSSAFDAELLTAIHANYSIIASCLPFLKPLTDSLAVGLITNDVRVPIGPDNPVTNKAKMNSLAILSGSWSHSQHSATGNTATASGGKGNNVELHDLERYGSQERMVIKETKTTVVASVPRSS